MALLAVQAARLVWIVAEPATVLNVPPSEAARVGDSELAGLTRFNPFAARHRESSASNLAADLAMSLYGVRTGGRDGGSAIIGIAGAAQAVFGIGEEVQAGTVLKAVAADHVELAQGSRIIRLQLAPASAGQGASAIPSYLAAPLRPQPAKPTPIAIDPKKFFEETGLRPYTENGKVTGYTVLPRGDAETLRRAGLEAGDVLVGLNGSRISPERYSELERELSAPEVQLTVQRGSETKTITLQTGR